MLDFGSPCFWVVMIVLCIALEAITLDLVSIWFAVGCLAAFFVSSLGFGPIPQLTAFVICSAGFLAGIRPICKKWLFIKKQPTNADRIVGMEGIVVEEINNLQETGGVKVNGLVWSARSNNDAILKVGERVEIMSIQGAKVIVKASGK